jgi:chemotaxis protein MotB
VPDDRFYAVLGKADTEPLFPDDPTMAANRRIAILVMREAPVVPVGTRP